MITTAEDLCPPDVPAPRADGDGEHPPVGGARQQTESRLCALVAASPLAIVVIDPEARVQLWNPAAERLFGWREAEVIGQAVPLIPEGRLPECVCCRDTALRGETYATRTQRRRRDGSLIAVSLTAAPLRDARGEITEILVLFEEITERKQAEEALRRSQAQLEAELADTQLVQRISGEMVHEDDLVALYEKILDAAVALMRSDFGSMQMLYPERGSGGELKLLACRGFSPEAVKFWEWVRADSGCTCGHALRTGKRAIAPDVARCDFMAGTEDQAALLQAGMHAAQTTPLVSRSGKLLGMITTHWRAPHEPEARALRLLDILARQAADLIERRQAEEALQQRHAQLRAQADELARFNRMAVGRELRMIELKREVNELCFRQGQPARYPLEFEADGGPSQAAGPQLPSFASNEQPLNGQGG